MKIRVFSDIHWEFDISQMMKGISNSKFWSPVHLDTDKETILILAGDLWNDIKSIDEIETFYRRFQAVVVVLGNHDFYDTILSELPVDYENELIRRGMTTVHILDNSTIEIDGKLIVGSTLWTNMDSYNPVCMVNAHTVMVPDFKYIMTSIDKKLSSESWISYNNKSFDYIKNVVEQNKDKEIIVITHHGCSKNSIHPKYLQYGLSNYFFISEYDDFIRGQENIKYWIHGHVHDNFNYMINQCNVIVNPRGYSNENYNFDENSLYEV